MKLIRIISESELKRRQPKECHRVKRRDSPEYSGFGFTILYLAKLRYFVQGSHGAGCYDSFGDLEFFRIVYDEQKVSPYGNSGTVS